MTRVLERVSGALYRLGLHHEDGASTVVSLSASPVRLALGELSASAADGLRSARNRRRPETATKRRRHFELPDGLGPSNI